MTSTEEQTCSQWEVNYLQSGSNIKMEGYGVTPEAIIRQHTHTLTVTHTQT